MGGGSRVGIFSEDAMHGTSCVSSAISVCHNYQSFTTILSSAAVADRCWTLDHRVLSLTPLECYCSYFPVSAFIQSFISN